MAHFQILFKRKMSMSIDKIALQTRGRLSVNSYPFRFSEKISLFDEPCYKILLITEPIVTNNQKKMFDKKVKQLTFQCKI